MLCTHEVTGSTPVVSKRSKKIERRALFLSFTILSKGLHLNLLKNNIFYVLLDFVYLVTPKEVKKRGSILMAIVSIMGFSTNKKNET